MKKRIFKIYSVLLIVFLFLALLFYLIGGEQIKVREEASPDLAPAGVLQEISEGTVISQTFTVQTHTLDKVTFLIGTYDRKNSGILEAAIIDEATGEIWETAFIDASLLPNDTYYEWPLTTPVQGAKGKTFSFTLKSRCPVGEAPTLYYTMPENVPSMSLNINGVPQDQLLCFRYVGNHLFFIGMNFWQCIFGGALIILLNGFWTL